jgi:AcrR family transcriptional regulator
VQDKQAAPAPLRADARRNREQIIQAARTLFLRIGTDVPMEDIARAAGVGVGTLYRRFPDREQLIKAVALDNFIQLAEVARRVERDEPDPAVALTTLMTYVLDLRLGIAATALADHGGAPHDVHDSPPITEHRAAATAVLDRLLERAQRLGAIRPDIGPGDLVLALALVTRLIPPADDELGDMAVRRLFTVMMDGLSAVPGTTLPGRQISHHDLEVLRRQHRPTTPGRAGVARHDHAT